MEGIALDPAALDRGVQEAEVEKRVVADQDGPVAAVMAHRAAHLPEDTLQRVALGQRGPQRVPGIDAIDLQGGRLHVGALEGLHVVPESLARDEVAVRAGLDEHRGDFQQGVGARVEPAGFHVHHHRQKTAETARHHAGPCHFGRREKRVAQDRSPASDQRTISPARNGTRLSAPAAYSAGGRHSRCSSSMRSSLSGRP